MSFRGNALAVAVLTLIAASPVPAAPEFDLKMDARRFVPGELIVMTMTFDGDPEQVRVHVFRKDIAAFKLARGRWRALVGIDLDQRPGQQTVEVHATTGSKLFQRSRTVTVAPRKFATRALRVDPDFVNPPPDQLDRIASDSNFLREVYSDSARERLWTVAFVRPVTSRANSRFGTRSVFNGEPRSPHGGTDFLSPAGTPVKAPNAGRIVCARDLFFTGNTVIIDHGLNTFSMLAHLSRLDVREGESVAAGQLVGLVGATGRVTGPHLHWAFSVAGARVDPLSVVALLGTTSR